MYRTTALPRLQPVAEAAPTPWDRDPALREQLEAIVAATAEQGTGARLVMIQPLGRAQSVASVRCSREPWRALADIVLDLGDARATAAAEGIPVFGPQSLRGVLLFYGKKHHHRRRIAEAYAGQIEAALTSGIARQNATQGAIDALLTALTTHDRDTARHSAMVCRLARVLGAAAGLDAQTMLQLERAALLHDIGKVGIPAAILQQETPLGTTEWGLMRQHPSFGERVVRAMPDLADLTSIIRHHHERWDGGGYPDRLSGPMIPYLSRILMIADAYETMRSGRTYRKPLSAEHTVREIKAHAGTQFDPGMMELLEAIGQIDLIL